MRSLNIYLNKAKIGTLSESDDIWRFEYDLKWVAAPDSFDLSPALQRSKIEHQDGSSQRPVQWYFDNLLPEENLREVISKEAHIHSDDAFGLITYLGAESAGSLILLPPDQRISERGGLRELTEAALYKRIQNLPRVTLSSDAPKRMSVAGAQNKLLVVYRDGKLYEPSGSEPSTHILKPNHESVDYPASVMNEYLVMSLALKLKLRVPAVYRKYTPEPVYIVERFDRYVDQQQKTQRRHIIDACQLLNKSRAFKYKSATLETLAAIIAQCRNRIEARMQLYSWLVFNILIANNDNHLKNISFMVSSQGIEIAPAYDLLSTGAYHTKALAENVGTKRADWPDVAMAIYLPGVSTFGRVTRESIVNAGTILGLTQRICERELDRMVSALPLALDQLIEKIEDENQRYPDAVKVHLAGELRLIRTIKHIVIPFMIDRVSSYS